MTSDEIRKAVTGPNRLQGIVFFLQELAAQAAEANEIARAQMLSHRLKGHKQAATVSIRSVSRMSSGTKRFYVDRWKTATEQSMMPTFIPKEGFKGLDDLIVGESSEGLLGSDNDGKVKRIQ
jgi:hypothetical protein